jgi:NitT/TauT family transport system permease protein
MKTVLRSRKFWLMLTGYALALLVWYASVKWVPLKAFTRMPDPWGVISEWLSPQPAFGISIFSAAYYKHIFASTLRAWAAFALAVGCGIPLGILMGWSRRFNAYASALVGLLRPVPPLAWVPLAILLLPAVEVAVVFVTFLVAFFATTLNTLVGVQSIDPDHVRAARCLGASRRDVLFDIIIPGALPQIFTGLQIAMGAAWFSLAAGEMIAAQYGLGFLIMDAYSLIQYPTIVIAMGTLGLMGFISSAIIREVGNRLMRWRLATMGVAR